MDHVSIVVDDLAAATTFFVELGLKLQGEGPVEGGWVDRVVGLEGIRADIAMLETPDGQGRLGQRRPNAGASAIMSRVAVPVAVRTAGQSSTTSHDRQSAERHALACLRMSLGKSEAAR